MQQHPAMFDSKQEATLEIRSNQHHIAYTHFQPVHFLSKRNINQWELFSYSWRHTLNIHLSLQLLTLMQWLKYENDIHDYL